MTTPDTRPATPRNSRRVSRRVQLVIVTGVVLTAGIVGVVTPLVIGSLADQPEHARFVTPAGPRGIFAPTQQQWRDLGLRPVTIRAFRSERTTEGNIAIDDDLTTPVFSPYSGRVTKLIARLGDRVAAGGPLFEIQASEFVQVQNDLITGLANLQTARSQLGQAQTNEKRTHQLYLAQGKGDYRVHLIAPSAQLLPAARSINSAPLVTTFSPTDRPPRISTIPSAV